MKDHDVRRTARLPVGEAPPVAHEIGVELEGVDVGGVPPGAERIPHQPRGVADRVPAVQRGNPLVDPHGSCAPLPRSIPHVNAAEAGGGIRRLQPHCSGPWEASSTGRSRSSTNPPKSVARISEAARF